MAVYFDYVIQPLFEEGQHKHVALHKSFPLLAVASSLPGDTARGLVSFYLDEGEPVEESLVDRGGLVTRLMWHPTRKLLASSWSSGLLNVWNEHDKEMHEQSEFHQSSVSQICWNVSGSRLVSADEDGLVGVWKIDQRGRMQPTPMFRHEVSSPVIQMVFKLSVAAEFNSDVQAAVRSTRAAVNGEESSSADMYSWQRSAQSNFGVNQADSIQLFLGAKDGNVFFLDDRGKCNQKYRVEGAVKFLLFYEAREIIITITEQLLLCQHLVKNDECTELVKVKLSGQAASSQVLWAGTGMLATACKEQVVRILDIDNDENHILNLDTTSIFAPGECVSCISYNKQKGILAGGTSKGNVAMWKFNRSKNNATGNPWEPLPPSDVCEEPLDQVEWGSNRGLLAANSGSKVTILNESVMNTHFNEKVSAVQVSPTQLSIEKFPSGSISDLKTDVHIKGVYVTTTHATIWNNKKVVVYELGANKSFVRAVGSFNSDCSTIVVYDQNVYLLEPEKVSVRTFQGTVKQELSFTDQEGEPVCMNICAAFMVIGTSKQVVKLFDLSRREAKQVGTTKFIEDAMPNVGTFKIVKCNCNGTKVAFLCNTMNQMASSFLYVWDVETDTIQSFDFMTGRGKDDLDESLASTQEQLTSQIKGCAPRSVFWDASESKMLVCETTLVMKRAVPKKNDAIRKKRDEKEESEDDDSVLVVSLFSTFDHGIIVQDHFNTDISHTVLLGVDIPHYYYAKASVENDSTNQKVMAPATPSSPPSSPNSKGPITPRGKNLVALRTMRDFVGIENANESVRDAMMSFSYLSAIGNMDEAFKAIKVIKSGSVWENMARMCVKTKRLDVAMVCLGNMSNAAAAKAIREAQSEPELDARVAMLALQLGMNEEAENLYKSCGRYDLLNQFYQASNNWAKAVDTAENHDRIHLRTTYYNYGKYLESTGNILSAMQHFERSDTHRFEVPRMLFEEIDKLEAYISKSKDKGLRKWWAQYMESCGDMDAALLYYETAQDYLSLVRVHCYCGNQDRAAEICNDTGNKAACYHLARQYDGTGDIKNAIHYFSRAQAYTNAIRLAKENEMNHELMNLALLSTQEDMLDAARYFEEKTGMEDKAVMLYHKGGSASKAIDLAFRCEQFGALQLISEDLDDTTSPEVLDKCAEFFIEHGQFDRAVNLLVVAKRYKEALKMCMEHHVTITEELAERISLPKEHEDQALRTQLLERVAECAFKQGSFHLATKKFTQAGNKVKAMKSLLKSGDTEKIVFFAGVSRQREIYIMAANYLQSLDWRTDPEVMKSIISFYTKGRALDSLASFYDACAQVEIDEYQNYEKAFGALTEGYKCLSKAKMKNATDQEVRLASMKSRLTILKKFVQAKRGFSESPEESLKTLQLLVEDPDTETAVRIGDVMGLLIEHQANQRNYEQAHSLMEELQRRVPATPLRYFVDQRTLEQICTALGVPMKGESPRHNGVVNGQAGSDGEDGEEMEEEVVDEADDDDDEGFV